LWFIPSGLYNISDDSKVKWGSEMGKTAIEGMRDEEKGSYKLSRIFNLPQTTLRCYVKDRQENSSEAIKKTE